MRRKDDNKRSAIVDAAMRLITTEGFADTSMSKIAKAAGVSPATIYIYFENKQDLLDKLYLEVKEAFFDAAYSGLGDQRTVKENFRLSWKNSLEYFLANPVQFTFHEQFIHSPLVSKASLDEGMAHMLPFQQLFERGRADGSIPDIPIQVFAAITYGPLISLIKNHHHVDFELTEEVIMSTFDMCWRAIQD